MEDENIELRPSPRLFDVVISERTFTLFELMEQKFLSRRGLEDLSEQNLSD
jgi:hypothetical protein